MRCMKGRRSAGSVICATRYPSGFARATAAAPSVLPAPGRFSVSTVWPKARVAASARPRICTSVAPPGGKGTSTVMGRSGKRGCARNVAGAASRAAAPSRARREASIQVSPLQRAADDLTHDLAAAAIDAADARIGPGAADLVFRHVAVAAMQLQEIVEQLVLHLGAQQLGRCGELHRQLAA